jgi:tRNA (guanine10-N2)-dimethyltransferase
MLLAFELSGEHETLPKAEVLASLHTLSITYEEVLFLNRIVVIDAHPSPETFDALSKRLGMTQRIYQLLGMSKVDEKEILELVKNADLANVLKSGGTFAVRVITKDKNSFPFEKKALIKSVGELIKRKGYVVNLSNPSKLFVLLITKQIFFFCLLMHSRDKNHFERRKPHHRPFFSPGVIHPKIARVLVNLSGAKENDLFLDLFCGTGGLLLEADLIGACVIGIDVQEHMVRGSKENLNYYGLTGDLIVGDAAKAPLKDNSIAAVATDMPYGRSSLISCYGSTESLSRALERLSQDAIDELYRVLKPGGKAVIVTNFPSSRSSFNKHKFHLLETHTYRVHKSLNRYISVLKKE